MNYFALFSQLWGAVSQAIDTVSKDKGKPWYEVVTDVINHLTPGAPNSPSLNG